MTYKDNLQLWVREALGELGGEGDIPAVAKQIWLSRENDLRQSGDHFYTWQYDMRWAAQDLRKTRAIGLRKVGGKSVWTLKQ